MKKHFITILVITFCSILFPNLAKAQPNKGEFIKAAIGLGISAPNDNTAVGGSGFYAQGEYVFGLAKWFGLRPYAGVIFTSASNGDEILSNTGYKVTSNAFLLGGKARILAPIPYVAPYFEIGVGASIGSFKTFTPQTDVTKNGIIPHIPFTIGLAIGRKHNFDFAFTYYYHSSASQFSGATAVGFIFPI
jgi:hypothetical protein